MYCYVVHSFVLPPPRGRDGEGALLEYEINCEYQADECCEVVPMKLLPLEEHVGNDAENYQRDDFLYDFQLHQREWSSVIDKSDTICRHQEAVLYAGNQP